MFNLTRKLSNHFVIHCIMLCSDLQCLKALVVPHIPQHLLLAVRFFHFVLVSVVKFRALKIVGSALIVSDIPSPLCTFCFKSNSP